ncbi:hypothetical protein WJX74_007842 [Apatococcus lobatus]|uniref:Uncharacterized protein n=2 Tax=Apatococcus TaxID=904362 RepID=A0AAW1SX24_9CHLO
MSSLEETAMTKEDTGAGPLAVEEGAAVRQAQELVSSADKKGTGQGSVPAHRMEGEGATGAALLMEGAAGVVSEGAVAEEVVVVDAAAASSAALMTTGLVSAPTPEAVGVMVAASEAAAVEEDTEGEGAAPMAAPLAVAEAVVAVALREGASASNAANQVTGPESAHPEETEEEVVGIVEAASAVVVEVEAAGRSYKSL